MMMRNKIISAVLAGALFAGVLPPFSPTSIASSESTQRVAWTGYDTSNMNFSAWDGATYDTSWYTGEGGRQVHAGTREDPYLIEDADDLAGLEILTHNTENDGYLSVNADNLEANNSPQNVDSVDIFDTKTITFYDKSADKFKSTSYYTYTSDMNLFGSATGTLVGYAVQQSEPICKYNSDELYYPYYFHVTGIQAIINNHEVLITNQEAIDIAIDEARLYFEDRFDRDLFSPTDIVENYYWSESNLLNNIDNLNYYRIVKIRPVYDWNAGTFSVGSESYNLIDYDVDFSGMTAYNILGESVTLSGDALSLYTPCRIVANPYSTYRNPENNKALYASECANPSVESSFENQSYRFTYETRLRFPDFPNAKSIWEDTADPSVDFLDRLGTLNPYSSSPRSEVIRVWIAIHKDKIYGSLDTKRHGDIDLPDGVLTFSQDFSFDDLKAPIIDVTFDDVANKIKVIFTGFKANDGTIYYCDTPYVSEVDATGYKRDLSSVTQFTKSDGTIETISFDETRYKLVNTNFTLDEYENWYEQRQNILVSPWNTITASDPSFANKYFKLTTNIDLSAGEMSLSPNTYKDGYGFAGDFDLNDHIIRNLNNGFLFDTILESGRVHNGTLTGEGACLVNYNYGTVSDLMVCTNAVFDANIAVDYTIGFTLVDHNMGIIEQLDVYEAVNQIVRVSSSGLGYVKDSNVTLLRYLSDSSGFILYNLINCANIVNITVDADSDILGSMDRPYNMNVPLLAGEHIERVCFKDFKICTSSFMPLPISGNAYYCSSYMSNTYTGDYGNVYAINNTYYTDAYEMVGCTINSDLGAPYSFNTSYLSNMRDCNITFKLAPGYNSNSGTIIDVDNVVNCDFDIEWTNMPCPNNYNLLWVRGNMSDCDVRLKGSDDTSLAGFNNYSYIDGGSVIRVDGSKGDRAVDNCTFVAENFASNRPFINTATGTLSNSTVILKSISPVFAPAVNAHVNDCMISAYYTNLTKDYSFSLAYSNFKPIYTNSVVNYYFDETCMPSAVIEDPDNYNDSAIRISSLKNSIVSIKSDSDNISFGYVLGGSYYGELSSFTNSVVLLDNIKFSRPAIIANSGYDLSVHNFYLYANDISSDCYCLDVFQQGVKTDKIISDVYVNLQFKDSNDNPPINLISIANGPSVNMCALNNVVFISNTTNSASSLCRIGNSHIGNMMNGNMSFIAKNIYFDLRDAQNDITPSATADGFVPGLFAGGWVYDDYNFTNYMPSEFSKGFLIDDYISASNIIVPTGTSTVCQYYNPDTITQDSWNFDRENRYGVADESKWGSILNELELDNVAYLDDPETAMIDGSLAYMLDNGQSQYRRSRSWSVLEEDLEIFDPLTNRHMFTIPKGLCLSDMNIKPYLINVDVPNLSPIYKLAIDQVENGSVTTVGLNNKSSADGDIYVKQDTILSMDEQVNDDRYMFAYATQSFYGSTPSKIPSTAGNIARFDLRNSGPVYTIDGYKINAADTVITPVFKTARYITVNIDGAENATVIPSASVSTSGETITLTPNYNDGYIVTDLKVNGEPLTKSSFVMPDADVEITGKAVTFDGGITKYSVFGFNGVIDQIAHTINVTVPRMGNISNALADIEYVGDYITPSADMRVDLTNPVTYTVTYNTDKTIDYLVTVTQSDYAMRITDFVINNRHANINQATRTITLEMPYGTDLSNLTPDISYSAESIAPASNQALDFRVPQVYTLYASGMDNVSYTVTITNEGDNIAEITEYVYSGYEGKIDNTRNTITLNIPSLLSTTNMIPSVLNYSGRLLTPSKSAGVTPSDESTEYTVESQNGFRRSYNMILNLLSDDDAEITRFVLGGYEGVIDNTRDVITITVPRSLNLVDVVPNVLNYTGKSVYPRVDIPQDFTNNPVYTVVAMDNSERPYTVNVEYLNDSALITYFEIYGFAGEIDQTNKTITVKIPNGFDISNTVPTVIEYSENAVLDPVASTARDFTQNQQYTVTSQDGLTINTYTVTCIVDEAYDNRITKFVLDNVEGEITDIGSDLGTISITINEKVPNVDYSNIVPDLIRISTGATINPVVNTARDFANTDPIYVVTGAYSGDRTYTVHLNVVPLDRTAKITEFVVDNVPGVIDEENGKIVVTLPGDTTVDITNIDPDITWQGRELDPDEDDPQDFTNPVVYTVTAEDPRVTKEYTVEIIIDQNLSSDCIITKYAVGDYSGVINQSTGVIKFTIPKSKKAEYNTNLVPANITWQGDVLNPDDTVAVNIFNNPQYTVSTDTNSKTYTVKVEIFDDTPNPDPGPTPRPDPKPDPKPVLSDKCSINYYSVDEYVAKIDQEKLVISLTLPMDRQQEFKNIVPSCIDWTGAKLNPVEKQIVDLTSNLKYTVYAENPAISKTYTVEVEWAIDDIPEIPLDKNCIIEYYSVRGYVADINQRLGLIQLTIPEKEKSLFVNIVPDKIDWTGSRLVPFETAAVDLTNALEYTVYAEDEGISKTYTVKVNWIPDDPGENPDTGDMDILNFIMRWIVYTSMLMVGILVVFKKKDA